MSFATGAGGKTANRQTTPEGHSHRTHLRPHDLEHLRPLKEAILAFIPGDVMAGTMVGGLSRPNNITSPPTPAPIRDAWETTWWTENRKETRRRTDSTT